MSIQPRNAMSIYKFISFLQLSKQSQGFVEAGELCDPHGDLWSRSTWHDDGDGTELWQFKTFLLTLEARREPTWHGSRHIHGYVWLVQGGKPK